MRAARRVSALLVIVLLATACRTATFIETSEDVLRVAPVAYDTAMTFARENKAKLSRETLEAFETVRVQFPPAYRAFDSAFAAWLKSGKKDDPAQVRMLRDEVDRLVQQLQALVTINGGPKLGGGGKP